MISLSIGLLVFSAAADAPAKCESPPTNMVCVEAGKATIGDDKGNSLERPAREVELATFYLDQKQVTLEEFAACAAAGACREVPKGKKTANFDWFRARDYCAWQGKRLPTEFELEKATAGKVERAGYEWSATWAVKFTECGSKCKGVDPLGPCEGAYPCPKNAVKTLKDGPKRRFSALENHKGGFRCASTTPYLHKFPPLAKNSDRPSPKAPDAPSEEQKKIFSKVRADDTMEKKPCPEAGRAFLDCRDPRSYVKSNEPRQALWRPYIENLGGGYVGVGSDQQYSFIGLQRPEWAWLFDYDPQVINLHHVYQALIMASESPEALVERFNPAKKKESAKIVLDFHKGDKERWRYRETYLATRGVLYGYLKRGLVPKEEGDEKFGWLRNKSHYEYVRLLYQQGRITLQDGDMLAKKCLFDIGTAARNLGIPVRVYYPSNAPELWYWTKQYRKNVRNLPFDEKTVVLQTTSGLTRRHQTKKSQGYWHYNVMGGLFLHERMSLPGYNTLRKAMDDHTIGDDPGLSVNGLRSE